MIEVSCKILEFNQDWDNKLKHLIEFGTPTLRDDYAIRFKLHTGTRKVLFLFTKETYDVYDVWVANKSSHYGQLDKFNYRNISSELTYAASQETLDKLYEIELKLKNKHFDYNRIYK